MGLNDINSLSHSKQFYKQHNIKCLPDYLTIIMSLLISKVKLLISKVKLSSVFAVFVILFS